MIIHEIDLVKTRDVARFAWSRLARFQNIQSTTAQIAHLHAVPKQHLSNAQSMAQQIKYCLNQAREYFEAATSASLATKPVLLYYSTMSLALAEILLKQNGNSRLAKLRENHNCHGLQLILSQEPKSEENLSATSSYLVAKTQTGIDGNPKGTFEVWKQSARELPIGGYVTTRLVSHGPGTTRGFKCLLIGDDLQFPRIPERGLSLMECLSQLPYMADVMGRLGVAMGMVRATISALDNDSNTDITKQIVVQPSYPDQLTRFSNLVRLRPESINFMNIQEFKSGQTGGYTINLISNSMGEVIGTFPTCTTIDNELSYFSCLETALNEFGYLYVALHICGTFARYYPDIWLKHIELSSPLAMAIDELCAHAFERLPLLALSELDRRYYVLQI